MSGETIENWVFLGDSLCEGVGSSRIGFVGELAKTLPGAEMIRLRPMRIAGAVPYDVAGMVGERAATARLLLWNLGCEGTTVRDDASWLWLLRGLAPARVFILRGALESILRPAAVLDGRPPVWLPGSWRAPSALDPRCYFSQTWWRRAKQTSVDAAKQAARRLLLRKEPGRPLLSDTEFVEAYDALLARCAALDTVTIALGLPHVDERVFPGSGRIFRERSAAIGALAAERGSSFVDWPSNLSAEERPDCFYRDGFHPNARGAAAFAQSLVETARLTGPARG